MDSSSQEIINGTILEYLHSDADWTLSEDLVWKMLRHAGFNLQKLEARQHLVYLAGKDKELILFWKHDNATRYAQLLPRGKDVLEGRLSVPGVMGSGSSS